MDKADRLRKALRAALECSGIEVNQAFLSITGDSGFQTVASHCETPADYEHASKKLIAEYRLVLQNFADACLTIEDLYTKFGKKIQATVRNYPKISIDEVEDVEQIVYAQAIEKRWLSQYTGKTKFTTFIYTYVRQAIQNYINIRDSAGRVASSGTRRYYPISELLPEDIPEDAFLDFINNRFSGCDSEPDRCDAFMDSEAFIERCKHHFVSTLLGDVAVYEIVCGLAGGDGGKPEAKERDVWPGEKEVVSNYGISAEWLQRVIELLRVFYTEGPVAAEDFLGRNFFK